MAFVSLLPSPTSGTAKYVDSATDYHDLKV